MQLFGGLCYLKRIDRTRTGYPTVNMPCRKLSRKAVVSMVLFTPYALPMSYYPFTVLIKRSRYVPSCSFVGDSATPKGCAGIEPATTQRVSPRLLPSALVRTDRVSSYRTNLNMIEFPYASSVHLF